MAPTMDPGLISGTGGGPAAKALLARPTNTTSAAKERDNWRNMASP
jgi:hypothetical protein